MSPRSSPSVVLEGHGVGQFRDDSTSERLRKTAVGQLSEEPLLPAACFPCVSGTVPAQQACRSPPRFRTPVFWIAPSPRPCA